MTTATKHGKLIRQFDVNLSQRHAGQICTPSVHVREEFRGRGKKWYVVQWAWFDASLPSGRQEYARGSLETADFWEAVRLLRAEGISTDDHRF